MPRLLVLSIAFLVLTGCAAQRAFDEGRELIDAGKIPEGLARIDEAYRLDPRNQSYREQYIKQRDFAVQRYLTLAEKARIGNLFDEAQAAYQQALVLDSANPRASACLESLRPGRAPPGRRSGSTPAPARGLPESPARPRQPARS